MILDVGGLFEVYSENPHDGWAFPSLVGTNELIEGTLEYFDPWDRGD